MIVEASCFTEEGRERWNAALPRNRVIVVRGVEQMELVYQNPINEDDLDVYLREHPGWEIHPNLIPKGRDHHAVD